MMRYSFLGYITACAITLIICYVVYRIFLESKLKPAVNRIVAMTIYVMMFMIPLISALFPARFNMPAIDLGEIKAFLEPQLNNGPIDTTTETEFIDVVQIITWVYLIGVLITGFIAVINVSLLFIVHRNSEKITIDNKIVYLHDYKKLSSFSWINHIYLQNQVKDKPENEQRTLLLHEQAHVSKLHFIDLLIAQLVIIFQWFNPASWLLRAELQRIHEYEADADVLNKGTDEKEYQLMLINNISRHRYSGLTDGLNNCSLKKRIIMMQTKKFKSGIFARTGLVLLAAAMAGAIIHIPALASALSDNEQVVSLNDESPLVIEDNKIEKEDYNKFKDSDNIYSAAEIMPMYKGGDVALMNDIAKIIRYPEEAYKNNIQGRVVVQFVVKSDGKIGNNIKIVRSVDKVLDEAAINAIKALPNDWTPGSVNGKPVSCLYTLPITFSLSKDSAKSAE